MGCEWAIITLRQSKIGYSQKIPNKSNSFFLSFANYFCAFIKYYAKIAHPFYIITGKSLFIWGDDQILGGELIQVQNGQEQVVRSGSCSLSRKQLKYCNTKKRTACSCSFYKAISTLSAW